MHRIVWYVTVLFWCVPILHSQAGNSIKYYLLHDPGKSQIQVILEADDLWSDEVKLVIPRSAPGTYDLINYIAFVDHVRMIAESGKVIPGEVGLGSYFQFDGLQKRVEQITYTIDLAKMEVELLDGASSSKSRDDYIGILGYSVFGFIEGRENDSIDLFIETGSEWPVFSTLAPSTDRPLGSANYQVSNYAELADAQFMMGPGFQAYQVPDAPIPLYIAVHAETPVDVPEIGRRALLALDGLSNYFGYLPMPHYTVFYEFIRPVSSRHDYGFSMEHLNSMTSSLDTSQAIKGFDPDARIAGIVHHMGHCWIPLRSYGAGYRPFTWQVAPLQETIWLHEGFTWYIAIYCILKNKKIIDFFNEVVWDAPDYVKEKSLKELSYLGSTQYSKDFNIGRNLFSRGALMAYDLDQFIQTQSEGRKSFKDVALGLLHWTEVNQRGYTYEEIPGIIREAVGLDIMAVWEKWQ